MKIGVSTACLYPLETETALRRLCEAGISSFEIFFNADCELRGEIYEEIKRIVRCEGLNIISVHPYTSAMETMSLFGNYQRRCADIKEAYKRYFEIMNELGAGIFVLHGALKSADCSEELYFERYSELYRLGRSFGVTVAQENVSRCKSGSLDFLREMKRQLGEECGFVLDVKQARRSGLDPLDMVNALGGSIVHCHLSDSTAESDCAAVGKGEFDFGGFAAELNKIGYKGEIVLELYRNGFGKIEELKESVVYMEGFF
ncbi:MAG: sugar phosphate isomerase/epimerase [Bacteroides sp.]|nr:sugar phosphate isomerase/epimerase [Bacteroides sp.]